MVGVDGVDDGLALVVLPGQLHADGDVGALHLVVDGLAQVVEQSDGVVEHVLAVAGAVAHPAQELHQLRVQAVDVGLKDGALALGLDGGVHLPLGLLHHLLDAGGVDAAVQDQLLQGQPGDLPADGVKAGDGDGLRRVVDDQVHPGQGLQGADVAALAADDAALHLVVGQGDHRHRGLGHMVGGAALDGQRDDLPGLGVRLVLEPGLDLLDLHGGLVGHVGLQLVKQVGLGLLGGKAGDLLQLGHLLLLELFGLRLGGLQLGETVGQMLFLLLHVLRLAVQVLFLLLQPALLLLQVGAALFLFLFVLVAGLQDLLLGLDHGLPLLVLCALIRLVDDLLGLVSGGVQILLRLLPLPQNAEHVHQHSTHQKADDSSDDILHVGCLHLQKYKSWLGTPRSPARPGPQEYGFTPAGGTFPPGQTA